MMRLTIQSLGKRYKGNIWGLRDLDLVAGPGILGLLGPNGAGKTTLMNILATVTKPTQGTFTWNGENIVRSPDVLRVELGYLPQDFGVYPNLSAVEFLTYLAALKGMSGKKAKQRIWELLEAVNLTEVHARPLATYSGGMKQRVGIAQALLNDPRLLLVDEPTAGLDPEERIRFRNMIVELAENRVVILSTHIVSDVEAIATRIVLLNKGQLLVDSSPEKLLKALEGKVWDWIIPSSELVDVRRQYEVSSARHHTDGVHVRMVAENPPSKKAIPVPPTLEEAYLHFISMSKLATGS
jgi:ABC-2 type transport system ATP-binding protein